MSTVSRIKRKLKSALFSTASTVETAATTAASATASVAVATGSAAKRAVVSGTTLGFVLGSLVGSGGYKAYDTYTKPAAIQQPATPSKEPVKVPDPAPAQPEAKAPEPAKPVCKERRASERYQMVKRSNSKAKKPVWSKKRIKTYQYVDVACPEVVVTHPIDNPPLGTPMFGFKGLGGTFDEKAFADFATKRGYTPVVVKSWPSQEAEKEVDAAINSGKPYALYGFSLGGQTVRNVASHNQSNPPLLAVTVGASSGVPMKDSFNAKTRVEHYFHTGTKHDVQGVYVQAPHSGNNNIQRVVADKFGIIPVATAEKTPDTATQ